MSAEKTNEEIVTRAFVKQYYHTLNESPQFLHMFYKDSCLFNRLGPLTHVKKTVWTRKDVKDEFLAVKFEDFTAEVDYSLGVPYPMEHGRIVVFVDGHLTRKKDNVRNRFTQTFLLAQQDNGFCVVNDIFRFKKGQTQNQTCFLTETDQSMSEPERVAS
ncbi:nuclear transport factor 2 [Brassica rapa]|uniref:NTF2 domain-containing protein n=1 Tax=Brassica campestris TaxID=3711 RepID=M4DEW9_BRACM|nr:nuclear transport factor 2 [Brassica rapa]